MARSIIVLASIGWLLCACAPTTPGTQVEQDWSDTMKRYSLIGLYPITEDLQPGDVLLDIPPSTDAEPQPRLQRLGSLDHKTLVSALVDQEDRRLRLEAQKPDKPAATQPGKPGSSPASPEVIGADSAQLDGKIRPRLRRVALPAITAARIYDWQIGGAGPIGRAAVALGLAGNGAAAVLVHLQNLELAGFDTLTALDLMDSGINDWVNLNNFTPFHLLRLTAQIDATSARRMCRGEAAPPADERAVIRVVNRVLYAHDIEYEFTRSSAFAGRLAADLAQSAAARTLVPAAATATGATTPATPTATTGAGAIDAATARVTALSSALAANTPTTPGVRATLGIGMFGNVAMKEHHDQPKAVGFVAAANFTVRNSLLLSRGRSGNLNPETELKEAREFCAQFFSETEQSSSMIRANGLSPIENIICYNTVRANRDGRLAMSSQCLSAHAIPYEWTVGPQRRDTRPHSVF